MPSGRPARSGLILARRVVRNSRISLRRSFPVVTSPRLRRLTAGGSPCQYPYQQGPSRYSGAGVSVATGVPWSHATSRALTLAARGRLTRARRSPRSARRRQRCQAAGACAITKPLCIKRFWPSCADAASVERHASCRPSPDRPLRRCRSARGSPCWSRRRRLRHRAPVRTCADAGLVPAPRRRARRQPRPAVRGRRLPAHRLQRPAAGRVDTDSGAHRACPGAATVRVYLRAAFWPPSSGGTLRQRG